MTALLLDVDGVLSPFLRPGAVEVDATWPDWHDPTGGLAHHTPLSRQMADKLAVLPGSRVWCTTWKHEANCHIAPRVGWDEVPVLEPDPDEPWAQHGHVWKLHAAEQYFARVRR